MLLDCTWLPACASSEVTLSVGVDPLTVWPGSRWPALRATRSPAPTANATTSAAAPSARRLGRRGPGSQRHLRFGHPGTPLVEHAQDGRGARRVAVLQLLVVVVVHVARAPLVLEVA